MELEGQIVGRWPADIAEPVAQEGIDDETDCRAQTHDHRSFREKLTRQLKAAGAERLANGQLPLAGDAARQQQSGHVAAGDHREHGRRAEQHHEEDEEAAVVAFAGRTRGEAAHGPETRDLLREVLAADCPGRGNQGLLRLVPREPSRSRPKG